MSVNVKVVQISESWTKQEPQLHKIKDGEVEFKDVHERLHSISKDFDVLDLKCNHTKQWV